MSDLEVLRAPSARVREDSEIGRYLGWLEQHRGLHFADYPQELLKYYKFLDALKPETARKLARENLQSVLPKSAARLTEEESARFNGRLPAGTELLK